MQRRSIAVLAGAAASVCAALPATAAAERWTVAAPGGEVVARVEQAAAGGPLTFAVALDGRDVLEPSPLGIVTSRGDLTTGLRFTGRGDRDVRERYRTLVGRRRDHDTRLTATTLRFAGAAGQDVALEVRVSRHGAAYRYVLGGSGPVRVEREASAFRPADVAESWLQPYTPSYEGLWGGRSERSPSADLGEHGFPALFRLRSGAYALLAEADVDGRYVSSLLTVDQADPSLYHVTFPQPFRTTPIGPLPTDAGRPGPEGTLPLATPWRVVIAGGLRAIATSDLVTDLAHPQAFPDTSWIRPGKVAWSWWSDNPSPRSFDAQRRYVDFAAAHRWPYVLVDEGWTDIEARIPELVAYARERGVGIVLWFRCDDLATPEQRARLEQVAGWGVAGVKVDFFDSDTQDRMRLYQALLEDTARLRLMLNFHGATVPKGWERTWPQLLTMEAVRGAEYYPLAERYPGVVPPPGPRHNTILPFTRGVLGPTDYTPVTFSAPRRTATDAHELALAVVLESGWQHFADSADTYDRRPDATAWLDQVPVVWDDSELLGGAPGREATFARRAGREWWIGSIVAGEARTLRVPMGFLPEGSTYEAEVVGDGPGALTTRRVAVAAGGTLPVAVSADGGFLARLRPMPSLGLPSARRCVSRRRFTIRLRAPRGERLRSARIRVANRRAKVLRGRRLRARIDLRGLPRGRFRVRIVAVTTSGRRIVATRTYRTCTPRRRPR